MPDNKKEFNFRKYKNMVNFWHQFIVDTLGRGSVEGDEGHSLSAYSTGGLL